MSEIGFLFSLKTEGSMTDDGPRPCFFCGRVVHSRLERFTPENQITPRKVHLCSDCAPHIEAQAGWIAGKPILSDEPEKKDV